MADVDHPAYCQACWLGLRCNYHDRRRAVFANLHIVDSAGVDERRRRIARAEHPDLYRELQALDEATPASPALAPLLGTGEPGDVLLGHPATPARADSRARRAAVFLGAALATAALTALIGW